MPENPTDSQKDVGQFNAWLHNIGPAKAAQRQAGQPAPAGGAPRPLPKPAVPPGGGILGDIDSDVDDVFGRIVSDAPSAPFQAAPVAAAPRPPQAPPDAPQAAPQQAQRPAAQLAPRPEPPKAPPSRADVDRIIAAAQAQLRPQAAPQPSMQAAPPPRPAAPMAPQPVTQPQSIFGRPIVPPQRPAPQAAPAIPTVPEFAVPMPQSVALAGPAGGDASLPAQMAQLQQQHQQELARVENSFLETKNQLQKQVRDIQQKYQEQRTKWENVLADLRIRNDELLRRNQELEQQIGQMTERHHQLIQEYADLRNQMSTGQTAPAAPAAVQLPEEMGAAQGELLKGEFVIPAIAPPHAAGGITIEALLPEPAQPGREHSFDISLPPAPARIAQEATFQIPGEPAAEPPSAAEADDLLAELDALEKEMKDIGGK